MSGQTELFMMVNVIIAQCIAAMAYIQARIEKYLQENENFTF